ncbi:NUDIX hydrolase [Knoellia sinensis KCTC 19936]|uniref:NUDIX hydrolase n=1 Tax=Knoellia sinensis KCTC 19936 TaxID=1385520 RepID=A0A0A0J6A9_9MICO|nr:NUDIX domain-containing protein [Knoellia sinensis]KGN32885.1 NUDIX hydrolase [Knoellia sinensis KCTC 19936]
MIDIVALQADREVVRFALEHGADPATELATRGWSGRAVSATRTSSDDLTITYAVRPGSVAQAPLRDVPHDDDVTLDDLANVVPYQRIAAYAVVRSSRGILATELSARTNAAGLWNLPGGGLDPGEDPGAAVVREVHEETGQHVVDVQLLTVMTRHWVGRAPSGRVEDFHAVRLFHTAHCPEPTDPVVHDVGGSTSAALWVPETELANLPLAHSVPDALAAAGVALRPL